MTITERAQALADRDGRPWWVVTMPGGPRFTTPRLAEVGCYDLLLRFNPRERHVPVPRPHQL